MKFSNSASIDAFILTYCVILFILSISQMSVHTVHIGCIDILFYASMLTVTVLCIYYLISTQFLYKLNVLIFFALLNLFVAIYVSTFDHAISIIKSIFIFVLLMPYFLTLCNICIFIYTQKRILLFISILLGLFSLLCCSRTLYVISSSC